MLTRPATRAIGLGQMILKRHLSLGSSTICSTQTNQTTQTTQTTNGNSSGGEPALKKRIFASLCIERMPVITCDMNELEQRYSTLINEINVRRSYLSNHELRHLADLERAEKKRQAAQTGQPPAESDMIVETALDFEDKGARELSAIQFAERKLAASCNSNRATDDGLKNVDHILDKKVVLLVHDKATDSWQLPNMEWTEEDSSLRSTSERYLQGLNQHFPVKQQQFKVDFLGNAPAGVYKTKTDSTYLDKIYFFKAQYKSGAELLAGATQLDYVWIRKDELKDFIKNKDYLQCLNDFILDF